uniref:Zgc:158254 n=1 Tax=Eptatretus burgeri TaxID=7764 RepID=A0A8C4NAT3_EPTBU
PKVSESSVSGLGCRQPRLWLRSMGRDDSVCSRPYYIIVMVFMHTYVANVIALLLYVHFYEPAPRPPAVLYTLPKQSSSCKVISLPFIPTPPEIPKFLSHEDTRLLIALAQLRGLRGTNSAKFQQEAPDTQYDGLQARWHLFQLLDRNQDGKLQPVEVRHVVTCSLYLHYLEWFVHTAGCVGQEAFLLLTPSKLWTVLNGVWPQEDSSLEKYARSTWLQLGADAHQLLKAIWTSVFEMYLMIGQVGITTLHVGITNFFPPILFSFIFANNRKKFIVFLHLSILYLLRYITAILYLTNITEGGETVFPVADNRTYNAQVSRTSHACKHGNLRISPQAGSLLLWYNYLPDGKGWVGEQDEFGLHTGCPVKQGMKWIAVARIGLCFPHGSPGTLGSHSVHQAKEVVESELNRKPETSLERKVDGEVGQRRSEL